MGGGGGGTLLPLPLVGFVVVETKGEAEIGEAGVSTGNTTKHKMHYRNTSLAQNS